MLKLFLVSGSRRWHLEGGNMEMGGVGGWQTVLLSPISFRGSVGDKRDIGRDDTTIAIVMRLRTSDSVKLAKCSFLGTSGRETS